MTITKFVLAMTNITVVRAASFSTGFSDGTVIQRNLVSK